MKTGKSAGG